MGKEPVYKKGQRIQLHPATDLWMQGERYGEIVQVSLRMSPKGKDGVRKERWHYKVRLDKSERAVWINQRNIQEAVS